jgi:hypothetical protein
MTRRHGRRARWWIAPAALALLILGFLLVGVWRPTWSGRGRAVVGVIDGRIEVAWGTVSISRSGLAWKVVTPNLTAHLVIGPESSWLPSTSRAQAAIGTPAAITVFPVRVVYVPLWSWVAIFAAGAAGLWLWGPCRVQPGACGGCGYDLAGLTGGTCPECGDPIRQPGSLFQTIVSLLRPEPSMSRDAT